MHKSSSRGGCADLPRAAPAAPAAAPAAPAAAAPAPAAAAPAAPAAAPAAPAAAPPAAPAAAPAAAPVTFDAVKQSVSGLSKKEKQKLLTNLLSDLGTPVR